MLCSCSSVGCEKVRQGARPPRQGVPGASRRDGARSKPSRRLNCELANFSCKQKTPQIRPLIRPKIGLIGGRHKLRSTFFATAYWRRLIASLNKLFPATLPVISRSFRQLCGAGARRNNRRARITSGGRVSPFNTAKIF